MNNSELLFVRARCLYSMGSLDECVKHLKQILSGDPDNKKAREEFKRVKVLAAKKAEADMAYKSSSFDSAVSLYTEAIDMAKDNPAYKAKLYNNRATAHSNLRNHEECVSDCTEAIKLDPDYAKAYNKRAASLCILGEKKDIEKAIQDYEKYASLAGEEVHREVSRKIKAGKVQLKRASRKDFYKILGVKQDATESEIKKAYRKSALKNHPDRHANSSEVRLGRRAGGGRLGGGGWRTKRRAKQVAGRGVGRVEGCRLGVGCVGWVLSPRFSYNNSPPLAGGQEAGGGRVQGRQLSVRGA